MPVPYQRWIIGGLWGGVLVYAARKGLTMPAVSFPNAQQHFWAVLVFSALVPLLLLLAYYFYWRDRPYDPGAVANWVDRRFGAGSALLFLRTLRPLTLFGCGAMVMGLMGLLSTLWAGSGLEPFTVALLFAATGAWLALGSIWVRRMLPHTPF